MLSFLADGGAMGERIRDHDWSDSTLGAPEHWPQPLKTLVGVMLGSNQPMFVVWGSEQTLIYNDSYSEILARKHPAALGRPFLQVWEEIAEDLVPIVQQAYSGTPVHMDDIRLVMNRNGQPEDAHFAFSYTPVRLEHGVIRGFFCACTEITRQVHSVRALRESEARAHQIFDSVTDYAIIATDLEGHITHWNEGAVRTLGWSEEEMLGQLANRIFTPQDRANARPEAEMRQALAEGCAPDERWHVRKNGEYFWATGEMTPLRSDSGEVVGFVKVLRDRTEQREAERRLAENEARFRQLASTVPGFLWTADSEGLIDYLSPRWSAYTGSDMEHSLGTGSLECVHPDDRDRVVDTWARARDTAQPYEAEFRLRRADGVYRWWLARAVPVADQDEGAMRWGGACSDIQEIVQARELLARSHEELEAQMQERIRDRDRIWRLSTDVMVVASFDGMIHSVNPRWASLFGWREDELLGRDILSLVHPDDAAGTAFEIDKLSEGITTLRFENRYRHKNGSYRWLSWTAVPDARFLHAVGRDIQSEKEAAEALRATEEALRQAQKMEAVGQLTGGIAHDFNNLLTGVIGSLDLMQMRISAGRTGELERYVSAAMTSANRAAGLTHRLLAFSRRQPLDPKPLNANRLVTSMEELLRRTIGESSQLEIVTAGGLWQTLCDSHQLESALLNLAINARDAMPGGGKLTIETCNAHLDNAYAARSRDVRPGQYVCICVSDTGIGMTKDTMDKAFEPFFTTKPIGQGTGLGLSMIYGFARQSEGYAKIYSELGAGTTVKLYLPRYYGEGEDAADAARGGELLQPAENGGVVLVVEDETAVRDLVVEVLSELGYRTIEAVDGPSGLAIVQSSERIDLLVTDVGLPGLNGRQLADAARQHRPDLKVLFMTGYAENAAINGGFLDPGMELVTKPFAIDALAQRVRAMIEQV